MAKLKRWDEKPPKEEKDKLIGYLKTKGLKNKELKEIEKAETRRDLAANLRTYLRDLPKAT